VNRRHVALAIILLLLGSGPAAAEKLASVHPIGHGTFAIDKGAFAAFAWTRPLMGWRLERRPTHNDRSTAVWFGPSSLGLDTASRSEPDAAAYAHVLLWKENAA
jgi:hypothetical protein